MRLLVLTIIVVAVVGLMVGVYIAFPNATIPKKVVETSIEKLLEHNTFSVENTIELDVVEGESSKSVKLVFTGDVDKTDKEGDWKTKGDLNLSMSSQGSVISILADIVNMNNVIYIKIKSLPDFGVSFLSKDLINSLTKQWISIDINEMKKMAEQYSKESSINDEQTKEFINDLKELVKGRNLFTVIKKEGSEELHNSTTLKYLVEINKEELKKLIPEYIALAEKYMTQEQKAQYEKDFDKAMSQGSKNIDELWKKTGGIKFYLWVNKKDMSLARINYESVLDSKDFNVKANSEFNGKIKIVFDMQFFNFDKQVQISAPQNYIPIEQFIMSQMNISPNTFSATSSIPQE